MEVRRLGRTDIVASVLGFGGSEVGYQRVSGRVVGRLASASFRRALSPIASIATARDRSHEISDGSAGIHWLCGSRSPCRPARH